MDTRKTTFIYSAMEFFPDAFRALGDAVGAGQTQHIDGATESPVWDRTKSNQHMQSLSRHLIDYAQGIKLDDDNTYHLAKIIWRAMAQLQTDIENGR